MDVDCYHERSERDMYETSVRVLLAISLPCTMSLHGEPGVGDQSIL